MQHSPICIGVVFQGGFAWCYEAWDLANSDAYAIKVIPKSRIRKAHHREKVLREITTHERITRACEHPNLVVLYASFEDSFNIYMVLELCYRVRTVLGYH